MDKKMTECYYTRTCSGLDERVKTLANEYNKMKSGKKAMPDMFKFIAKRGIDSMGPVLVEEYPCEGDVALRHRQAYQTQHNVPHANKATPVKVRHPLKKRTK